MKTRRMARSLISVVLWSGLIGMAVAQDSRYSFSGDAGVVSKYIWRGQRLTNDWSLQPSVTAAFGGFSFNIWGTLDLTAVNEGDALFLPENPLAPAGEHSGLQGKFSEIDYTFSFSHSFEALSLDVGTIFYTFPERSASLPTTTELYGGVSLDSLPLAPSATLYVDIDETGASGDAGLYLVLAAGHSIPFNHAVFGGIEISGWLAFANRGFGEFYYGASESGAHDVNLTIQLPMHLSEQWSAAAFVSYSALLGGFRDFQFQDPRELLRGTAGSPASYADTVWGGLSISLSF